MFTIDIDANKRFVSIAVSGLLDEPEANRYVASMHSEFVSKIGAKAYLMMIDTTKCAIQSQKVVETFSKHIATFPKATKIALVNGNSLVRIQLRRVLTRDYAKFFDTAEDALPWLFDKWLETNRIPARGMLLKDSAHAAL